MQQMFDISEEILAKAKNCDRDFACLTEEDQPSCKISHCVNDKILFLEKLERHCPYHLSYAHEYVCNCPVRIEIYQKYGV